MLAQDQATDEWGFANSKSLRKKIYEIAADAAGPKAAAYAKSVAHEERRRGQGHRRRQGVRGQARQRRSRPRDRHEVRHGRLTVASTLLHMAIAIATLAILLHRRWPWFAAIALSAVGVAVSAWAFL